jgi:uncharacterized damage-inducible protein DinB
MQTAVKSPVACALVAQFDLHTRLFNNVLDGLSDLEANSRPSRSTNNIKWLAGHLTSTRFSLKDVAEIEEKDPYATLFGHGQHLQENIDYPSIDRIRELWNDISDKISAGLSRMPEEVLNGPAPARVPIGDDTFEGMLAFLMHHEAYHIGQMALLRKQLGRPAMKFD